MCIFKFWDSILWIAVKFIDNKQKLNSQKTDFARLPACTVWPWIIWSGSATLVMATNNDMQCIGAPNMDGW